MFVFSFSGLILLGLELICCCGFFNQELWREIGESDDERDAMLLQIEQECLAVYGRNVDDANAYKLQLQKQIDACKVEIEDISSSMGEQHMHVSVIMI